MAEVSKAQANLNTVLGSIGTGLGAVNAAGGVAGILGFQPGGNKRPIDPEDRPVTWREMALIRENIELKSNGYTDAKISVVKEVLAQQAVHNTQSDGLIQMIGGQVAQLYTLTKLYIPNQNVAPGWGPAFVMPGMPPFPAPVTPPITSSGSDTSTATPATNTGT